LFSVVFFSLGFCYLLGAQFVLNWMRKDYANYGVLRNVTVYLQAGIFLVQFIFVLLSFKTPTWPLGLPDLSSPTWVWSIGLVLIIAGAFIVYSAFREFDSIDRVLGRQVTVLKKNGIYRWSRNPQYAGYGLILLGIPFLWYTDHTLVAVLLYAPVIHRLVLVEEEHLKLIFKDKYTEYCEETYRYFGRKPLMTKVHAEKYSLGNS